MMGKRHTTKIAIGISLQNPAKYDKPASIESIFGLLPEIPLTWCIPSVPVLSNNTADFSGIISTIKERIKKTGDTVLSMGHTGASHFLLTEKEVKKELSWGIKNLWNTGTDDIFHINNRFFFITNPDFSRPEIIQLYSQKEIHGIIIPAPASTPYSFQAETPALLHIIQAFSLSNLSRVKPEKDIKYLFPKHLENIFVIVSLESVSQMELLPVLCRTLEKNLSVSYSPFPDLTEKKIQSREKDKKIMNTAQIEKKSSFLCNDPVSRNLLFGAAESRTKENIDNETIKNILVCSATENSLHNREKKLPYKKTLLFPSKLYTANMPGEILLPGNTFDVKLKGGKLLDIIRDETSFMPGIPSSSFIRYSSGKTEYNYDRMFSFETESIRGLESLLSLKSQKEPHLASISYYFYEDCPWLVISVDSRYPKALFKEEVLEIAPIEIPLFVLPEHHTKSITSIYADGTKTETVFSTNPCDKTLFGSLFYYESNGKYVVFGMVPKKCAPITPLPCITRTEKKKTVISINPLGTYRYNSRFPYLGYAEHLSFYIGVRDELPQKIPFFPRAFLTSLPAPAVMTAP